MRSTICIVAISCGTAFSSSAVKAQPVPTVFGPDTNPTNDFITNLTLNSTPPFVHWDLREFPDLSVPTDNKRCDVPWTLGPAPVPDFVLLTPGGAVDPPNSPADRAAANAAFAAAFGTWAAVGPSLIGFGNTPAAGPATSGLTLDGFNTLNFADAALDDVQVAPAANDIQLVPPGNPVAAGDPIVSPGADMVLATTPLGGEVVANIPNVGPVIFEQLVGGNAVANSVANDLAVVAPGGAVVGPGPDGVLETQPQGDDLVVPCIADGGNGVANTAAAVGDIQVVAVAGAVAPGGVVILPGADGMITTVPALDDVLAFCIIDGGNGIPESTANSQGTVVGSLGLTGLFFNNSSGVLMEADITFAPPTPAPAAEPWVVNPATNVGGAVQANWRFNLQGVATHEIGHFIGIAHPNMNAPAVADPADGSTPTMWGTVLPAFAGNNFNQTLGNSDRDSCNFLYTPDLGDAPPLDDVDLVKFSTRVHLPGVGRTLNAVVLDAPAKGPLHKFGISPRQPGRNYTYEWIGTASTSDVDAECEARTIDKDIPFDDGVRFNPNPPVWGEELEITVDVRAARDAQNAQHNYAAFPLFVNLWIDLNTNSEWEEGAEHPINNVAVVPVPPVAGSSLNSVSATVTLPLTLNTVWVRARLDWGEMVAPSGLGKPGLSPTLNLHEGAAQFAEVEDYPLACPRVPVWDFVWSNDPADWSPGIWTKNGTEIGQTFSEGTSTGGTEPMHKSDHTEVPGTPNDWHWSVHFPWNALDAWVWVWFENFGPDDQVQVEIWCSPDFPDYELVVDTGNDVYTLNDGQGGLQFHTASWSGYPNNLPLGFEPTTLQRGRNDPELDGIPAVSEWGMIVMTLLAFTAGTIMIGRQRRPAAV